MDLPVMPPIRPMLAKSVTMEKALDQLPYVQIEPKWDGFRCLVFRDGDEVILGSRSTKELTRYFPDLVEAFKRELPERIVLDGEILLARDGRLEFDLLSQRIHPAESRVQMLAETTPAFFVAFDLLAVGDESLVDEPFSVRRDRLVAELATAQAPVHVTRTTSDAAVAEEWFGVFEGAGLDGVVAKPLAKPYMPNGRIMLKVKHARTADVVVAGYRLHKTSTPERPLLGSMLLGLYNDERKLQHVGVAASFTETRRAELYEQLSAMQVDLDDHPWGEWMQAEAHESGRLPGGQSRWTGTKDLSWYAIAPTLVAEVGYEHMEGTRFRHTAQFKRWRDDREPESCTYEQLEEVASYDLDEILSR